MAACSPQLPITRRLATLKAASARSSISTMCRTPAIRPGKLLGDTQDVLTALSTKTLFFALELNRIDDAVLDKAIETEAELKRYGTWFDELRKAKPYQLEDRVEELFHDKSQTGRGAWNRLFDETMASLKFEVDGEVLGLEPTLTLLTGMDEKKRQSAFNGLSKTLKDNQRLFTQITNVLSKDKEISDRWRGFADVATAGIWPIRSSAKSSTRWKRRFGPPIRACPTAITP